MNLFDPQSILILLEKFATDAPAIMRRAGLSDYADEIDKAIGANQSPFTMALVGQMRVGKSSLLNALVGEDLAITGVTETTATVNWFRHGTADQASNFRVVWNGMGGSEERPKHEIQKWIGDSELAGRTRFIEFFSSAEFLKEVQIVDTPGTRSVLERHEEAVRGFILAERRNEHDTIYYGGSADCIVYVLPPVAKESDESLLGEFASKTRLAGSCPYNSIGVLHKWETLDHAEPWMEAQRKAQKVAGQLQSHLATVFAVSGPLARAVQSFSPNLWNEISQFAWKMSPPLLTKLTTTETRFWDDVPECAVDSAARKRIRQETGLPWPCFTVVLKLAATANVPSGEGLKQLVQNASGIDRLLAFLRERFFVRSRAIRAATVFSKAIFPCDRARSYLRDRTSILNNRLVLARKAEVEVTSSTGIRVSSSIQLIREVIAECEGESRKADDLLRELETAAREVREVSEQFGGDLSAMHAMDDQPTLFKKEESIEIISILGGFGFKIEQRLAQSNMPGDTNDISKLAERRLGYWLNCYERSAGNRRRILEQVVTRLQSIANHAEPIR